MTDERPTSVVLAGFRETGKTTFLVALWHTVISSEVAGALTLEKIYEGDRDYITQRHNEWLAYEPVKRTTVDHDTPILMTLRDASRGRLLQLGIPDLSGETFKIQFEERRASPILVEAIRGAAGVALFINPKEVVDPIRIREVWDAIEDGTPTSGARHERQERKITGPPARADGAGAGVTEQAEAAEPLKTESQPSGGRNPADDFTASRCCSQVKYVDLLQQIIEHGPGTPLRCAVVVSAMDTLDGTEFQDRPDLFVSKRLSMVDQYLRTNRDLFDSKIYGVSAQGGQYDTATIETLAKLGSQRIRVCGSGKRDNDISRPVRWLAFGEE